MAYLAAGRLLDLLGAAAHALIPVCTCPQPSLRRVDVKLGVCGTQYRDPAKLLATVRATNNQAGTPPSYFSPYTYVRVFTTCEIVYGAFPAEVHKEIQKSLVRYECADNLRNIYSRSGICWNRRYVISTDEKCLKLVGLRSIVCDSISSLELGV